MVSSARAYNQAPFTQQIHAIGYVVYFRTIYLLLCWHTDDLALTRLFLMNST
jgi:hypothetical protein